MDAAEEIDISYVPLEMVGYVWRSQIEMIERGMSKGQGDWGSPDDMLLDILQERSKLWAVHRGDEVIAVVVIAVRANRHMTKLFVQLVAGHDIKLWVDELIGLLREFSQVVGADCIEASCRPGLAKLLKIKGWSQKAIIVELK